MDVLWLGSYRSVSRETCDNVIYSCLAETCFTRYLKDVQSADYVTYNTLRLTQYALSQGSHVYRVYLVVSKETVLDLLREAMQKCASSGKPYLIDGYPRELQQAKCFEASIAPVEAALYFQVSDRVRRLVAIRH